MKTIDEMSAEVYAELYVNGRKIDADDLVKCVQRLILAAERMLPNHHHIEDTNEQAELRRALFFLHEMKSFD